MQKERAAHARRLKKAAIYHAMVSPGMHPAEMESPISFDDGPISASTEAFH